jgi:uncharacterized circularly permuted ATP-grasp superfamily protein
VLWERKTEDLAGRRIDLIPFVRRNRRALLLKPNRGSSGDGVVLGAEVSPAASDRALARALAAPGHWIVQRRVETLRRPMV